MLLFSTELPKRADSSTANEASNFLTTPSGHPLQLTDDVEANSTTSTFSQPGNLTSVEPSSQSNHNLSGLTVPSVLPGITLLLHLLTRAHASYLMQMRNENNNKKQWRLACWMEGEV